MAERFEAARDQQHEVSTPLASGARLEHELMAHIEKRQSGHCCDRGLSLAVAEPLLCALAHIGGSKVRVGRFWSAKRGGMAPFVPGATRCAPVDAEHVDGVPVSKAGRTAQFPHPRLSSFILKCLFHKGYLLFYA